MKGDVIAVLSRFLDSRDNHAESILALGDVAKLIAAVEADFEIRKNILRYTVEEIQAATDRLYAALLACKGQDHDR